MTPVVASKANTRLRTTSSAVLENVAAGLTEVNVPTATILLPIWVIAWTLPFMTCGVVLAGLVETTPLPWSALTALPCGANATSESVVAAPIAAARR